LFTLQFFMRKLSYVAGLIMLILSSQGCKKANDSSPSDAGKVEVFINDVPFYTNEYLRIPFTLKTWEWRMSGYVLKQVVVTDDVTKAVLATYEGDGLPLVYSNPPTQRLLFPPDQIHDYYFSIQLPVPINQKRPERISGKLVFTDTLLNSTVVAGGWVFTPRYDESPTLIQPPVRGKHWMFYDHAGNGYHFYSMVFTGGQIGTGERFATDVLRLNEIQDHYYDGDPGQNSSYFSYGDTLYAVADGVVEECRDSVTDNDGNRKNHQDFYVPIDYAGNYLIINIGNGHYAMYAHCKTHSLMTGKGDSVKAGQPIALLGNSGNTSAPHLHFQVTGGPDFFMSRGQPFVFKEFYLTGSFREPPFATPASYFNSLCEQYGVITCSFVVQ